MKKLVAQAKTKGRPLQCEGCHENLADYTLAEGAEAKLVQVLRLVDDERAPAAPIGSELYHPPSPAGGSQ